MFREINSRDGRSRHGGNPEPCHHDAGHAAVGTGANEWEAGVSGLHRGVLSGAGRETGCGSAFGAAPMGAQVAMLHGISSSSYSFFNTAASGQSMAALFSEVDYREKMHETVA